MTWLRRPHRHDGPDSIQVIIRRYGEASVLGCLHLAIFGELSLSNRIRVPERRVG